MKRCLGIQRKEIKSYFDPAISVAMVETSEQLTFEMDIQLYQDTGRKVLDRQMTEIFLATIVQLSRELVSFYFNPQRLLLSYPVPDFPTDYLNEFLSRVDKNDLTYVIKNKIYEILPLGTPSQAEIAQQPWVEFT